jgi:hypothetical protein
MTLPLSHLAPEPQNRPPATCGKKRARRTSVCEARQHARGRERSRSEKRRDKPVRGHGVGSIGKVLARHDTQVGHYDPQEANGFEYPKTLLRHRTLSVVRKVFESVRRVNAGNRRVRIGNPLAENRRGARRGARLECEKSSSPAANARPRCFGELSIFTTSSIPDVPQPMVNFSSAHRSWSIQFKPFAIQNEMAIGGERSLRRCRPMPASLRFSQLLPAPMRLERYQATNFSSPCFISVFGEYPSRRFALSMLAHVIGTSPG